MFLLQYIVLNSIKVLNSIEHQPHFLKTCFIGVHPVSLLWCLTVIITFILYSLEFACMYCIQEWDLVGWMLVSSWLTAAPSQGHRSPTGSVCYLVLGALGHLMAALWPAVSCVVKQGQCVQARNCCSWEPACLLLEELPEGKSKRVIKGTWSRDSSWVGWKII